MHSKEMKAMGAGQSGGAASKFLVAVAFGGAMGVAALGGYALSDFVGRSRAPEPTVNAPVETPWIASAPGRIEAKSGEIRVGSVLLGRIAEIHVQVNDRVEADEVLVRLDDDEARARLAAAEAEVGVRERDRNAQPASQGREDVRKAEDAVYLAERAATGARYELDAALLAKRRTGGNDRQVSNARQRLAEALERLQKERVALAQAQSRPNLPAPSAAEAALIAARSQVALAQLMLDRTRIRSPIDGTMLEVLGKKGETVAPSPEQPVVVLSDNSKLLVKAEVDERDVRNLRVGQRAFVRSAAFSDRDFEGKVTALAPMLATPVMSQRGPRRPAATEVLEVTVELEEPGPLMPGLRVDVFFRKD